MPIKDKILTEASHILLKTKHIQSNVSQEIDEFLKLRLNILIKDLHLPTRDEINNLKSEIEELKKQINRK